MSDTARLLPARNIFASSSARQGVHARVVAADCSARRAAEPRRRPYLRNVSAPSAARIKALALSLFLSLFASKRSNNDNAVSPADERGAGVRAGAAQGRRAFATALQQASPPSLVLSSLPRRRRADSGPPSFTAGRTHTPTLRPRTRIRRRTFPNTLTGPPRRPSPVSGVGQARTLSLLLLLQSHLRRSLQPSTILTRTRLTTPTSAAPAAHAPASSSPSSSESQASWRTSVSSATSTTSGPRRSTRMGGRWSRGSGTMNGESAGGVKITGGGRRGGRRGRRRRGRGSGGTARSSGLRGGELRWVSRERSSNTGRSRRRLRLWRRSGCEVVLQSRGGTRNGSCDAMLSLCT